MSELTEKLWAQEQALTLPSFSNEDALALGLAAIDIVTREFGCGVAIQIERSHEVLFSYMMSGSSANNLRWIERKKNVVALFGHSSMYVGEDYLQRGADFHALYPPADYQAVGGGFPILLDGTGVIGSIIVSGLPSEDDHYVCITALQTLIAQKKGASAP